ncbi:PREDICTED: metal-response element-binding transcription factor 2-like [Priapulus caudatus]|uniref:Metal-response element-binding transcription factor 2-like n=1 Tax=Priapulus caudatus TaxID=37621 RepID=A0ABM1FB05_PRICU|nr:PREDICTED: metal-response element-binding transcription factor 2-like [Priapulus caudatus]
MASVKSPTALSPMQPIKVDIDEAFGARSEQSSVPVSPRRGKAHIPIRASISPKRLKVCNGKGDPHFGLPGETLAKKSQIVGCRVDSSNVATGLHRGRSVDDTSSVDQYRGKLCNCTTEQHHCTYAGCEPCASPRCNQLEVPSNDTPKKCRPGTLDSAQAAQTPVPPSVACSSPRKKKFHEGQECLSRWNDGLLYLATVVKLDNAGERCLVAFEDNSEHWVLFKDLQSSEEEPRSEVVCSVCECAECEKPNEIVICDNCSLGYHQQCHSPPIEANTMTGGVQWSCRQCVFAKTTKRGGATKLGPNAKALQAYKKALPYKLSSLTWDAHHKTNSQQCYCYCGGPGDWYIKMVQCCRCKQWFHEACVQCLKYPLMLGDRFYLFVCSVCNQGPEYIKRLDLNWSDVTQLCLFNLTLQPVSNSKYHDIEESIMPWISRNWVNLQLGQIASTPAEQATGKVTDALQHSKTRFQCGREIRKRSTLWSLRIRVPPQAPTVILPAIGEITDDVMRDMKMTGRKTKMFVPMQSLSPVPLRSSQKRRRSDMEKQHDRARQCYLRATTRDVVKNPFSSNQSYAGYNGDDRAWDCDDETSSQGTLDSIIPPPDSFDGTNNPFLFYDDHKQKKVKLVNLSETGVGKRRRGRPPKNAASKARAFLLPPLNGFVRLRPPMLPPPAPSSSSRGGRLLTGLQVKQSALDQPTSMQALKSSVTNYFGATQRIANGERFSILGRRILPSGQVQYLLNWE